MTTKYFLANILCINRVYYRKMYQLSVNGTIIIFKTLFIYTIYCKFMKLHDENLFVI